MVTMYDMRELYGGAIVANLPNDFLDASDLREIPDHQELFLSPRTLTSIIFEINEYQIPSAIESDTTQPSSIRPDTADEAASTYHFTDPIDSSDHIDPKSLSIPASRTMMSQESIAKHPAYIQQGTILSPELDKSVRSALPPNWASDPPMILQQTRAYQLLIRLEEYETDICVRVNVPLKEFIAKQDEAGQKEELKLAEDILQQVVASLDIKSFELFGA